MKTIKIYYSNVYNTFVTFVSITCYPVYSFVQKNETLINNTISSAIINSFYASVKNNKYIELSAPIPKKDFPTWGKMISNQYFKIEGDLLDNKTSFLASMESVTISWNAKRNQFLPVLKFLYFV